MQVASSRNPNHALGEKELAHKPLMRRISFKTYALKTDSEYETFATRQAVSAARGASSHSRSRYHGLTPKFWISEKSPARCIDMLVVQSATSSMSYNAFVAKPVQRSKS
jgi:hypothetical protein